MDREAIRKLNLEPRSDSDLHAVHDRLQNKWEQKARYVLNEPMLRDH